MSETTSETGITVTDTSLTDTSPTDASPTDTGATDTGATDTGATDTGATDTAPTTDTRTAEAAGSDAPLADSPAADAAVAPAAAPVTATASATAAPVTASAAAAPVADLTQERAFRKTREGLVVSDKMDKTVVVAVEDRVQHPLYKKTLRRTSKLKAHDEANGCGIGDRVLLMETRPLSASKRWRVVEVLEKAK